MASEQLDGEQGWRMLASGELVHVRPDLTVESAMVIPEAPPAASPTRSADRAQVYSAAISEVRDYLVVWRERGCPVATREFLVPDGGCDLILRSGKMISYRPYHWVSSDHFTLMVTLDLQFKGSPGAWNVGLNSRFITFSRTAAQSRYLMYMATGP